MTNDVVPFVPTRDDLVGYISDTHKEINGFRPRPNWSELTYEQLDVWGRELAAEVVKYRKEAAKRNRITRGLRRAQQRAWEQKKRSYFTPACITLGEILQLPA
jgi:hypothetical protein